MTSLTYNLFFQLIASIPFIYLIFNWKKTKIILKTLILMTFILTLFSLWTIIKYESSIQHPIYQKINLSQDQTNKTYEIYTIPLLSDEFLAGFEINSSSAFNCGGYNDSWPNGLNDVEVTIENSEKDANQTIKWDNDRTYLGFNCGGGANESHFIYSKAVQFNDPLKENNL